MSEAASFSVHDGIAVITLNNPPVNSLSAALRTGLGGCLKKAADDPAVKAIVLIGSAKAFSGGAEIREFNTPNSGVSPTLPELNAMQDELKKPLVAALDKQCLAGNIMGARDHARSAGYRRLACGRHR